MRVPDSLGRFNIRIMIAETWMTVIYKQVEDSQAVDTAQLQRNRSMVKSRESRRRPDMRGGPKGKSNQDFAAVHNFFIVQKETQLCIKGP